MTVLGAPQTGTMFQDARCQWAVIDSVTASGNKTATVTLSGTSNAVKIDLWRISGANAHGTPVGANGNSTTPSVNVTTTVANAAIFAGGVTDGGSYTAGSGYTKETINADSYNFDGVEYDIDVGAVGSKTVNATATSGQWIWNAIEIYQSAPVITAHPGNQTVYLGQQASFSVSATGTGTLHYQWKDDGSNVGTDNSTYAPTPALSDSGSLIRCDVSDDNGTAQSDNAVLIVLPSANLPWIRA
jgi:hypothetical protein